MKNTRNQETFTKATYSTVEKGEPDSKKYQLLIGKLIDDSLFANPVGATPHPTTGYSRFAKLRPHLPHVTRRSTNLWVNCPRDQMREHTDHCHGLATFLARARADRNLYIREDLGTIGKAMTIFHELFHWVLTWIEYRKQRYIFPEDYLKRLVR